MGHGLDSPDKIEASPAPPQAPGGTTDSKDSQTYPTKPDEMPSTSYFTADHARLEFTLCHRSPHWEFTVHNRATHMIWIDWRTPVPPNGTYTISRYCRTPRFRLWLADKHLDVDAMRVAITTPKDAATAPIYADFSEVPTRYWRAHSHALPLSVSVYGTARGTCTAVQYRNTSATDTLILDDRPLPPGETRTIKGNAWRPWTHLHALYASNPGTGKRYHCVTNVGIQGVYLFSHERSEPPAPAPAPAPPAADPHFDAPAFYPLVLQQLHFRNPSLLTDILRSQGFTPGQILAFQAEL